MLAPLNFCCIQLIIHYYIMLLLFVFEFQQLLTTSVLVTLVIFQYRWSHLVIQSKLRFDNLNSVLEDLVILGLIISNYCHCLSLYWLSCMATGLNYMHSFNIVSVQTPAGLLDKVKLPKLFVVNYSWIWLTNLCQ